MTSAARSSAWVWSSSSERGPEIVAGQAYERRARENVFVTDIVADLMGNFHAIWNFEIQKGTWGTSCAVFDVA